MTQQPPEFRFECTACGACCRRPGEVRFDEKTFIEMADALGIGVEQFRIEYDVRFTESRKEPWSFEVAYGSACPMLEGDLCRVHEVRPRQCRTYPFWPNNISAAAWKREAGYCPGIGRGPRHSVEEVNAIAAHEAAESDPD